MRYRYDSEKKFQPIYYKTLDLSSDLNVLTKMASLSNHESYHRGNRTRIWSAHQTKTQALSLIESTSSENNC